MKFKVSDKVVRVAVEGGEKIPSCYQDQYHIIGPLTKVGRVYVVERVLSAPNWDWDGLALVGHTVYVKMGLLAGQECGWAAPMFRLLSEVQAENRARAQIAQHD